MATVALSVIAPFYQGVADGYRGTGQADLLGFASAMERHHSGSSVMKVRQVVAQTPARQPFFYYSPSSEPQANRRCNLTIQAAVQQL